MKAAAVRRLFVTYGIVSLFYLAGQATIPTLDLLKISMPETNSRILFDQIIASNAYSVVRVSRETYKPWGA